MPGLRLRGASDAPVPADVRGASCTNPGTRTRDVSLSHQFVLGRPLAGRLEIKLHPDTHLNPSPTTSIRAAPAAAESQTGPRTLTLGGRRSGT